MKRLTKHKQLRRRFNKVKRIAAIFPLKSALAFSVIDILIQNMIVIEPNRKLLHKLYIHQKIVIKSRKPFTQNLLFNLRVNVALHIKINRRRVLDVTNMILAIAFHIPLDNAPDRALAPLVERKLIKIGAVFSSEERTLSDWLVGE